MYRQIGYVEMKTKSLDIYRTEWLYKVDHMESWFYCAGSAQPTYFKSETSSVLYVSVEIRCLLSNSKWSVRAYIFSVYWDTQPEPTAVGYSSTSGLKCAFHILLVYHWRKQLNVAR